MEINYENGYFKIDSEILSVDNLLEARNAFHNLMSSKKAQIRQMRDTMRQFHSRTRDGYYNCWKFDDVYFLQGMLFTLSGNTTLLEACYCDPLYKPPGEIVTETFDRRGRKIASNVGLRGRDASREDPGLIQVIVEGFKKVKAKKPSFSQLTGLPEPARVLRLENK
jgi:hypothetical protein